MTAGYWLFIRTMPIFNPPSNWPARPIVCMTIFIEWSRSDSDIPLLSPVSRGRAQAGWPRLLAGITTGPCAALAAWHHSPAPAHHVTVRTKKQNPTRTGWCSMAAQPALMPGPWLWSRSRLLRLVIFCIERRWIMSNLVSFTWIIDWKDKRVDLFTHNIDVLGSCWYVLCNSEHWTYFQGTCIRLYFVGILLISYWTHDDNSCPVAAIWNLLLCPKIMLCFRKKSGIITRPININSYFCLSVCHCRHYLCAPLCLAFCLQLSSAHTRPIKAASGLRYWEPLTSSLSKTRVTWVEAQAQANHSWFPHPRIHAFTVTREHSQWRLSQ